MKKWESKKNTKLGVMPAEGFKDHVATDGTLLGKELESGELVVGQWYSWTMMKRWGPCMGCTAQWRAEFEVQRTIKRAELTAFSCLLKVIGPIKVYVDNK